MCMLHRGPRLIAGVSVAINGLRPAGPRPEQFELSKLRHWQFVGVELESYMEYAVLCSGV